MYINHLFRKSPYLELNHINTGSDGESIHFLNWTMCEVVV